MAEMNKEPPTVKVHELARDLRMSPAAVYAAIGRGEIRAVRVGRTVRVPRAERNRLIEGEAA